MSPSLTIEQYNQLLQHRKEKIVTAGGAPLNVIPQRKKSSIFEEGYEPSIYLRGELQTRENNWHDFFNFMMWLMFPKTKTIINKWQYLSLRKRQGTQQKQRFHIENLLTQFDEGGMIVVSSNPELSELLKKHYWKTLFWERRQEVQSQMQFHLIGHAIHEKMLNPYVGITACALIFEADHTPIDLRCAEYLDNDTWCKSIKTLYPVPILGIPGWYAANEEPTFYDNTAYFRP